VYGARDLVTQCDDTGRMSRRLLSLAGSQARSAALVAAALVVGASSALALNAPESLSGAPVADTTEVVGVATPEVLPEDVSDDALEEDDAADGTADENTVTEDAGAAVEPVACDDAVNHGEYVSSVARTTPSGPGKGAIVSSAARSDCGKQDAADSGTEVEESDEPGKAEAKAERKAAKAEKKAAKGKGKRG